MDGKLKYYVILHLIVLIWGFTGILGDQISIGPDFITFFRTGISFVSLLLLGFFAKKTAPLSRRQLIKLLLTGAIVGLHWYTFFYAIMASTVSIGVVCMSSTSLFTSIIEPIVFGRRFLLSELLLSLTIISGVIIIFGFESNYYVGIISGLISALLAAIFTAVNGIFILEISSFKITKYEMLGGFTILLLLLTAVGKIDVNLFSVPKMDWMYLGILGIVCTTIAFMVSVWVMKFVTPFTVSMSVNMEPIYTIVIVLILDYSRGTHKEQMSTGFYLGALMIIAAIFVNAYIKQKMTRKKASKEKLQMAE